MVGAHHSFGLHETRAQMQSRNPDHTTTDTHTSGVHLQLRRSVQALISRNVQCYSLTGMGEISCQCLNFTAGSLTLQGRAGWVSEPPLLSLSHDMVYVSPTAGQTDAKERETGEGERDGSRREL